MADYLGLALTVFVVNIVPVFMPPTWFVLALALIRDPSYNPALLAVVGALSSTVGRGVLAFYSSYFRRFFTKDLADRADDIRRFFERKGRELFLGAFAYALTPFPSNVVFIADGLTKVDPKPVFTGFFFGRLISYYVMVAVSHNLFRMISRYFHGDMWVRYAFDVVGVVGAFSILLVDWKRVARGAKKL